MCHINISLIFYRKQCNTNIIYIYCSSHPRRNHNGTSHHISGQVSMHPCFVLFCGVFINSISSLIPVPCLNQIVISHHFRCFVSFYLGLYLYRRFLVPTHPRGFSTQCTSQATGFLLMTISVFITTSTSAIHILGMRYVAKLDSSLVKMKLDPALRKMSQTRHGRSRGHWLAHALIPQ